VDLFWEAIRLRVCRVCANGDGQGSCLLPVDDGCALEAFLPELATIVSTNQTSSHETYLELLRNTICAQCDHQVSSGTCRKRQTLACALDRYYPTVIEIIGTVKGELERTGTVALRRI